MSETLPQPPVPADTDLRDFPYMPLDVVRLRDSDLAALALPEEFRSAVMLWCASWHQIPAASVPDDDKILANLAGFGRGVTDWKKVRDGALRGWVKCSDGRLYHPVVAEKANEAIAGKQRNAHKKLCDRLRKAGIKSDGIPSFEQWISDGMPLDEYFRSNGNTPPIPRKSALKGIGERGEGIDSVSSLRSDTGAVAPSSAPPTGSDPDFPDIPLALVIPPEGDWSRALFGPGLAWLTIATGKKPDKLRPLLGMWLRSAKQDHRAVFGKLAECQRQGVAEPVAWMTAAVAQIAGTSGQQANDAEQAAFEAELDRQLAGA